MLTTCPSPTCDAPTRGFFQSAEGIDLCPSCRTLAVKCPECGSFNRAVARYCRSCGGEIGLTYKRSLLLESDKNAKVPIQRHLPGPVSIALDEVPPSIDEPQTHYNLTLVAGSLLILDRRGGAHLLPEAFARPFDEPMAFELALPRCTAAPLVYEDQVLLSTADALYRADSSTFIRERLHLLAEHVVEMGPAVRSQPLLQEESGCLAYMTEGNELTVIDLCSYENTRLRLDVHPSEQVEVVWLSQRELLCVSARHLKRVAVDLEETDQSRRLKVAWAGELKGRFGRIYETAVVGAVFYFVADRDGTSWLFAARMKPGSTTLEAKSVDHTEGVNGLWAVGPSGKKPICLLCPTAGKAYAVNRLEGVRAPKVTRLDVTAAPDHRPAFTGDQYLAMVEQLPLSGGTGGKLALVVLDLRSGNALRRDTQTRMSYLSAPLISMEYLFIVDRHDGRAFLHRYDLAETTN